MFGMKIQMNEEKILKENVINLKKVYQAIDEIFAEAGLKKGITEEGGVLTYWGTNDNKDFGRFTIALMRLRKTNGSWFLPNCSKWLYGDNEETGDGSWDWEDVLDEMRKRGAL